MWECIVADDETAVFGEIENFESFGKEMSVSCKNIFAICNTEENKEFEKFIGWCEISGKPIFEGDNYAYDDEDGRMLLR